MNPKLVFYVTQWLVLGVYLLADLFYCREFYRKENRDRKLATGFFLVALVLHLCYLVYLGIFNQRLPVATVSESTSTLVWLTAVIYLVLENRLKERSMGGFILSVLLIVLFYSNMTFQYNEKISPILEDVEFEIHVMVMLFAYGGFIVSFIASLMHTMLSRELQKRHLGLFFRRLPSLAFFEEINNVAVNIGLMFMTIGLILGLKNALSVWDPKRLIDPKILATFLTWAIYFIHFMGRRFLGWRGQRAASVSMVGFGWLIFSFMFISMLFQSVHRFY
ncbi:MAG: cytochrome c biogenesis protein CcsA [candidate division KSB1 bacterium]|nr:cytochrome c biogenesis protein CcsA [candidate division KSB1 bacterium]MDQ7064819.1 cytochrome c biogenesis protein CcsA [candidate division KSB1 bacterium]